MSETDRKALRREYKETAQPAGVFLIRNTATGRLFVGPSPNLPGMLNRQRFQLEMGSHPNRELQADWNALGPDEFEFGVLDTLETTADASPEDLAAELEVLKSLWLERLRAAGEQLYPGIR